MTAAAQRPADLRSTQIRAGVLAVFDPYNPGLELSIERQLDDESSVQFSAAYLRDFFYTTPYEDFSGARFGIAKKWSFKAHRHHRFYRGLDGGISTVSYITSGRFAIPNDKGAVSLFYREYYETFRVNKQTVFAGARIGVQGAFSRFCYDASVGLGVKYKRTMHQGRKYSNGVLFPGFIELDPYQISDRERNGLVGNMPMSLSVGWTF